MSLKSVDEDGRAAGIGRSVFTERKPYLTTTMEARRQKAAAVAALAILLYGVRVRILSLLAVVVWVALSVACDLSLFGEEPPIDPDIRSSSIWIDQGPDVGQSGSLTADSRGNAHISYYDAPNGNLKYAKLDSETGTWALEVVDDVGDVGRFTAIAIDTKDQPHIVYYDSTNDRLKYALLAEGAWSITSATEGTGGRSVSFALDASGVAHLAYFGHYDALRYRKWGHSSTQPVDQLLVPDARGPNSSVDQRSSIRIHSQSQRPIIAYYSSSHGTLEVLSHNPEAVTTSNTSLVSGWFAEFVDGVTPGVAGAAASLFVDSEDNLHLAYYDSANQDLKYASRQKNGIWIPTTVDSKGAVGEYASLVVICRRPPGSERECRPYISYYDATNRYLKVAALRGDGGWGSFVASQTHGGTYTSISSVSRGRVGVIYRDAAYRGLKFIIFMPF